MLKHSVVSSSLLNMKLLSIVMWQPQITDPRGNQHCQNRKVEWDKYYSCTQHDVMFHLSYFKNQATEIDVVSNLTLLFLFLILFEIIIISKIQNDNSILQWSVTVKLPHSGISTDIKYRSFNDISCISISFFFFLIKATNTFKKIYSIFSIYKHHSSKKITIQYYSTILPSVAAGIVQGIGRKGNEKDCIYTKK